MSDDKTHQKLANLRRATARFGEAVAQPATSALEVDGAIQRFEFTIELAWKTVRHCLVLHSPARGTAAKTPRRSSHAQRP